MEFTHADPERTAHVETTKGAFVFHYTDAKGKDRKKSFKAAGKGAHKLTGAFRNVLRLAVKEGFQMGHQPDGLVRWLVYDEAPDFGQKAFAFDAKNDRVWIAIAQSRLRAVQRGTGAEAWHGGLGKGCSIRDLDVDGAGTVWLLLDAFHPKQRDTPSYKVPAKGEHAYNIACHVDGVTELFVSVPYEESRSILFTLGVSNDGLALGPHGDGAAVYDAKGKVSSTHAVGGGQISPVGAISRNGRYLVLTQPDDEVVVIDRQKGTEKRAGGIKDVLRVQVNDMGAAHVVGLVRRQWGIYAVKAGKLTKISADAHAQVSPSGESVLEVGEGEARLKPAGAKDSQIKWTKMPGFIGREGRSIFIDERSAIVRMRGYTPLMEIDLKRL